MLGLIALVTATIVIHLGGTIGSPKRIVVADDMFAAQLRFPLYDRKIVFLADVTRNPETPVLPPLIMTRSEQRGRMILQTWSR